MAQPAKQDLEVVDTDVFASMVFKGIIVKQVS